LAGNTLEYQPGFASHLFCPIAGQETLDLSPHLLNTMKTSVVTSLKMMLHNFGSYITFSCLRFTLASIFALVL
jgi:hypothetical protein